MRYASLTVICFMFMGLAVCAFGAEEEKKEQTIGSIVVYFENDLFYKVDKYYSNAVQIRFVSPPLGTLAENGFFPDYMDGLMNRVERLQNSGTLQYNVSVGLGQIIYTPDNTEATELQKNDRPYAGYLYGFVALHAKQEMMMDTFELNLGVVGPSSLAENSQNEVHRMRNLDTANGWDNQLHDEPAFMLSWARNYRLNPNSKKSGLSWDILPYHILTAGNTLTQAAAGSEVRLGWNLSTSFATSMIRTGSSVKAPAPVGEDLDERRDWGVYLFSGLEGRAVAHNIFLDGNTWRSSHSVSKEIWVASLTYGVAVTIKNVQLAYQHVYLTKEFKAQKHGQDYGSITLTVPF